MARPQRLLLEDGIYHVTLRGNERREIFRDDADRHRFLQVLGQSVETFRVRLYLYCLMAHHVHMVVQTPGANLSAFMHRFQTAYTVYFNRRHQRSGHLVQGRFGATLVQEEGYLLKLSRYVHLNPVFVKAARRRPVKDRLQLLTTYPWSSYRAYIGKTDRLDFVDCQPIWESVCEDPVHRLREYRRFVEAGIENVDAAFLEDQRASVLCVGSEAFRDTVREIYEQALAGRAHKEDISHRRGGSRLSTEQILHAVAEAMGVSCPQCTRQRRSDWVRPVISRMLTRYGRLTQRQVAGVLGLRSGAAVSIQLRRIQEAIAKDPATRRQVETLERKLDKIVADLSFKG